MKTLSVVSQKGGSGKTTLSIHLAMAAVEDGLNVALVDLDPQASASDWHESRKANVPLLAQATASELAGILEECRSAEMDLVIVDTAPHSNPEAVQAARLSNYLAIPCRPTILDLRAIGPSVDIARQARKPAAVVFTSCPPPHGYGEPSIVSEARKGIMGYRVRAFPGQISQRAAFAHALIDGRAVTEFDPHGKAAQEVRGLWAWLSNELERAP